MRKLCLLLLLSVSAFASQERRVEATYTATIANVPAGIEKLNVWIPLPASRGPQRISDWLAERGRLPGETRAYVSRITGRPAEQWASNEIRHDPEAALIRELLRSRRGRGRDRDQCPHDHRRGGAIHLDRLPQGPELRVDGHGGRSTSVLRDVSLRDRYRRT